ncbi:MAG: peptidoglycan editing factor PgeF [Syntrophomonadaceae bacterium]|nr:peptidoglycan editing factor PgeF [Syntrophomonadaceae bacterium]
MPGFAWIKNDGISYITLPHWAEQGVNVAFSARSGGVSQAPYNSLNMGLHVDDKISDVIENRRRYLELFSLTPENMVCCEQVHGNSVAVVGKEEQGRGALDYKTSLPGYDAMVCTTPGIMLTTFYADCIPIFLFDPCQRVVAIAHSGWKGTMGRIATETLKVMQKEYNCLPEKTEVFIGPGIGGCCFNIGEELSKQVKEEFTRLNGILNYDSNGCTWDLQLTNRLMLEENGVRPENIFICDLCTACNTEMFFSYRREQGGTGRMAAGIGLNY